MHRRPKEQLAYAPRSQDAHPSPARNRWSLLLAALLFSTGGAAIKISQLTAWQIAGFRSGFAAIVILTLIPGARRNWSWRTAAVGFSYAATLVLFVVANKRTTAANAIFLQSTAPLYLLFLGPLMLRERLRRSDLLVFAAIAAGAVLLLYGSDPGSGGVGAHRSATGDLVAALSGFTWAWTIAGLRWLAKSDPQGSAVTATVIAGNLIAAFACLPLALPVGHPALRELAVILYLGVFQVALAYVLLTRSIRYVPAFEASLLLLVEPVFNPVWTFLLCNERPTGAAILGGAVIILAAFLGSWWQTQVRKESLS